MIQIHKLEQKDQKEAITKQVTAALPQWFNPPEDWAKKAEAHREYPYFAAFDGEKPVGFLALLAHNAYTAEIHGLGILKEYQNQGIGKWLVEIASRYAKEQGAKFLTVKTLDGSAQYEPYDATQAFYRRVGFYPLEVMPDYWDEENPCLFLLKPLEEEVQYIHNCGSCGE